MHAQHILRNLSVIVGKGEAIINAGPRCLLFSSELLLNASFEPKEGEPCPYESVAHRHSPGEKPVG